MSSQGELHGMWMDINANPIGYLDGTFLMNDDWIGEFVASVSGLHTDDVILVLIRAGRTVEVAVLGSHRQLEGLARGHHRRRDRTHRVGLDADDLERRPHRG